MKNILKFCLLTGILISYQTGYSKNKGLSNCSNSCYFNSSLQALSHLDKFNSQLNADLYGPADLIPQLYINLMNKIKGAGAISCDYKILENLTEQNFYDLVGITFFFMGDDEIVSTKPTHIDNKFIKEFTIEKEEEKKEKGKTIKVKTKIKKFIIDGKHFYDEFEADRAAFVNKYLIKKEDGGDFIRIFLRNQEDAAQFIESLLNKIAAQNSLLLKPLNITTFSELEFKCPHKTKSLSNKENLFLISLPILNQKQTYPLSSCLNDFFKKEDLIDKTDPKDYDSKDPKTRKLRINPETKRPYPGTDKDQRVKCDKCKEKVEAIKQLTIGNLPNYFTIQLKRFEFDLKTNKSNKILTPISFQSKLEISEKSKYLNTKLGEILKQSVITYNLLAFIVHNGSTPNSGHYWAYGKDKNNKWWRYDDLNVPIVTDGSIQLTKDVLVEPDKTKKPVKTKEPVKPKMVIVKIKDKVEDILKTGLDGGATPYILFYELDDASRIKLEELGLLEKLPEPKQPTNPLQQNLVELKESLQELKGKLQTLQDKLKNLKAKLEPK